VLSPLAGLAHGLTIAELLAYLALLAALGVRAARREPVDALLASLLAVVALAVRLLSAPRVPIEAANGDLTHLVDAATWLRSGLEAFPGVAYPPAYRLLLTGLFALFGPSPELGFVTTTVLGALTAVPVYVLARRLGGSRLAGVVGGLALAAYPPAVFFSNGITLVVPAALLLTLALTHLEALLASPSRTHAWALGLALALLVQCRLEALGIVALALLVAAFRTWQAGAMGAVARRAWLPALVLVAALGPYVTLVLRGTSGSPDAATAEGLLAVQAVRLAALCAGAWLASLALSRWGVLRALAVVGAAGAGWHWAARLATSYTANPFVPSPFVVPEVPFFSFHADMGAWHFLTVGFTHAWSDQPAFLPVTYAALLSLALAPRAAGDGPRVSVTAVALVGLPLAGGALTSFIATGIGPAEGLRLHVPYTGLVAAGVGVGAGRAVDWLAPGPWARRGLALLLGVVVLSPAVTHRAFLSDVDRDQRAEYLFARDALARLPDGATLLLPDRPLDLHADMDRPITSAELFRTPHLLRAVAFSMGRTVTVRGLRALPAAAAPSPVWFFAGLECYRAPRPLSEAEDCAAVRAVAGDAADAVREVPTRGYNVHSAERLGTPPPRMRFALVRLEPAQLAEVQRRVGTAPRGAR
jgi:hypothetical protein